MIKYREDMLNWLYHNVVFADQPEGSMFWSNVHTALVREDTEFVPKECDKWQQFEGQTFHWPSFSNEQIRGMLELTNGYNIDNMFAGLHLKLRYAMHCIIGKLDGSRRLYLDNSQKGGSNEGALDRMLQVKTVLLLD